MAIVDSKEGASWPLINLLELWLDNVKDDADSIFVVVPDNSLMSVCRVAANDSILLASELGWMVRVDKPVDLFLLHLHILLLLLVGHDESSVGHQLVLRLRLLHCRIFGLLT